MSENFPAVSVIVPVYNTEPYLRQCLDSIVNQTLKNIEIILVNDGSTDGSLAVLQEYAARDYRITLLDEPNTGAGAARNKGLDIAKGEYLSFLDSDDFFELNMLELAYNKAKKEDADIVGYGAMQFNNQQKIITPFSQKLETFTAWDKLYRTQLIKKYNIQFQNIVCCNDNYFTWAAIYISKKSVVINQFLLYYRKEINSICSSSYKHSKCAIESAIKIKDFLIKNDRYEILKENFYNNTLDNLVFQGTLCMSKHTDRQYLQEYIQDVLAFLPSKYHQQFLEQMFKISVIIPVYNTEPYLRECLDSIVNQQLKNIEIILVDYGSTDGSLAILQEYAAKDIRITVLDQKNQGQETPRKKALDIAKGKYIVFVDSEDCLRQDSLEVIYCTMEANQYDMLSFPCQNFETGTRNNLSCKYCTFAYLAKGFNDKSFTWEDCIAFLHKLPEAAGYPPYNIEFINNTPMRSHEKLFYEDNLFFLKASASSKSCGVVKELLYYQRIPENKTIKNIHQDFSNRMKLADMFMQYILSKELDGVLYQNCLTSYMKLFINLYDSFEKKYKEQYGSGLLTLLRKYHYPLKDCRFEFKRELFHYYHTPYKKELCIAGIRIYKRIKDERKYEIYSFGVQIFKRIRKQTANGTKTRISILGIPVYSKRKEG